MPFTAEEILSDERLFLIYLTLWLRDGGLSFEPSAEESLARRMAQDVEFYEAEVSGIFQWIDGLSKNIKERYGKPEVSVFPFPRNLI